MWIRRVMALLPSLLVATSAAAQRIWLTDDRASLAGVQISKGFLAHDPEFEPYFGSGSIIATFFGRVRLEPTLMVTAEIPLAHVVQGGAFLPQGFDATTDRFGNPWLGVQGDFNSSVSLEVGVRPALISQRAYQAPELASLVDFDHFDAWYDDNTVVRGILRAGRVAPRGVFTTGVVGATAGVHLSGFYLDYGVRAGYAWQAIVATVSGTGRLAVSHNGINSYDNKLFNQVEIGAAARRGTIRPTLAVRGFVDSDVRRSIKAIVTVGVDYVPGAKGATPSP